MAVLKMGQVFLGVYIVKKLIMNTGTTYCILRNKTINKIIVFAAILGVTIVNDANSIQLTLEFEISILSKSTNGKYKYKYYTNT